MAKRKEDNASRRSRQSGSSGSEGVANGRSVIGPAIADGTKCFDVKNSTLTPSHRGSCDQNAQKGADDELPHWRQARLRIGGSVRSGMFACTSNKRNPTSGDVIARPLAAAFSMHLPFSCFEPSIHGEWRGGPVLCPCPRRPDLWVDLKNKKKPKLLDLTPQTLPRRPQSDGKHWWSQVTFEFRILFLASKFDQKR